MLALCISAALGTSIPVVAQQDTPPPQGETTDAEVRTYNIPAQPLGEALIQFGQQSGLQVTASSSLVEGKRASAVRGSLSAEQALGQLLTGTDLRYQRRGGMVSLVATGGEGTLALPAVKVGSDAIWDGSATSGYVSQNISHVGPWQGRSLGDTPYSINVVSEELIENIQATTSPDQIFKINPVTQLTGPQARYDVPAITMRGFDISSFARNGITRQGFNYAHGLIMEEVESVEVLTGLSGFLYGGGNIGGLVNFVTKRPTDTRLNSVTLGNTTGQNYFLHGDFGGQFDSEDTLGYRINVVTQAGETYIDDQDVDRNSISATFDWQATENLLASISYAKRDYEMQGVQASWNVAEDANRPDADEIDPSKNWGQKGWADRNVDAENLEASLQWNISETITFRSRYLVEENERQRVDLLNAIQNDGTYNQRARIRAPETIKGEGGFAFLDVVFNTGSINHTLTSGLQFSESVWETYTDGRSPWEGFTGFSLDSPSYVPEPAWSPYGTGNTQKQWNQRTRTITIGDDITFNQHWSALLGLSDNQIIYDSDGQGEKDYDKSKITPTVSVIFKPAENLTTYTSYIEGLEQGGVAGDSFGQITDIVNEGELMEPLVSTQIELGAKVTVGNMLLTTALFEIDKSLEYYKVLNPTQAEFVQDGSQVHRGLEFTATGTLTDNLTMVGGFTLLDAQIEDNEDEPELEGNVPPIVSEEMYKVYLEYSLPSHPNLTLNTGVSYTGEFYGDEFNTDKIDGYTLVDVGARYHMDIADQSLTFRLNIQNLTDESYWVNDGYLGDPRTVSFSANMQF